MVCQHAKVPCPGSGQTCDPHQLKVHSPKLPLIQAFDWTAHSCSSSTSTLALFLITKTIVRGNGQVSYDLSMFRIQAGKSHKRWRTNAKFWNPSHHRNQHHLGHKSEPSTAWAPVVQTVQAADRSSYLYWTLLWSTAIFTTISGSENGLTFLTTFDLKHQSSFRSSFRRTQSHTNCSTGLCWITRPKWSARNYCPMAVMAGEVMGLFVSDLDTKLCFWIGLHEIFLAHEQQYF